MTVLVCIAYYGVPADLLAKSVGSVLAQTHTDLRLVVIGDGEAPPVTVTDDRLTVYTLPENHGPYFAQAVAIAASPFEWYATVGADDWIEPEHLESLLAIGHTAAAPAYWNGKRIVMHWTAEFGVTRIDRLRAIGGYNPAERVAQDTLTMALLQQHGGVARSAVPTYHYVRRPGSLTTSPETGMQSQLRKLTHERNRVVLEACRGRSVDFVRHYREGIVPPGIVADVELHVGRLAEMLA